MKRVRIRRAEEEGMYGVGMVVLLGLATVGTGAAAYRCLSVARELWALLIVLPGIGAARPADFDLLAVWGLAVRDHAIAVTLTGSPSPAPGSSGGSSWSPSPVSPRKFVDQARLLEKTEPLRRVA